MNSMEIIQSANALVAIALVMLGSHWLKQSLKQHFC